MAALVSRTRCPSLVDRTSGRAMGFFSRSTVQGKLGVKRPPSYHMSSYQPYQGLVFSGVVRDNLTLVKFKAKQSVRILVS